MNESQSNSSPPLSDAEQIDRLCAQFEEYFRRGEPPRIEEYLPLALAGNRDQLLRDLIVMEVELLSAAGNVSDGDSYYARFPQQSAIVQSALTLVASRQTPVADVSTTLPRMEHDTVLSREDDDPESLPKMIGRFAIEGKLGQGGFAVVYLARDSKLDRQVALKVPRPDRFSSEFDIQTFVDEARHVAGLDHPAIVRVHDVQQEAGSVYIVQQYIRGQDLAALAKSSKFSSRQIAELVIQVAEAVAFAHSAGFYHRDLKPANILIDEEGKPHVVDFGLAVHVSRQHEHRGSLAGSYPYMSPEQARGEVHRLDGRTDIWALGVILYELLTSTLR